MSKRRDYVPDAPWIGHDGYDDEEDEYTYDDYLADEEDRRYEAMRDEALLDED